MTQTVQIGHGLFVTISQKEVVTLVATAAGRVDPKLRWQPLSTIFKDRNHRGVVQRVARHGFGSLRDMREAFPTVSEITREVDGWYRAHQARPCIVGGCNNFAVGASVRYCDKCRAQLGKTYLGAV